VWKSFLRGLNPINYMELPQLRDKAPRLEAARQAMGQTLALARRMNLAAMSPRSDLASSKYCLADPGTEYLVYLPDGGAVTVDLSATCGMLQAEWRHPVSGTVTPGGPVTGGARRALTPPFNSDAVLYLHAHEQ